MTNQPTLKKDPSEEDVKYSVSGGLVNRLAKYNFSFAFTSYQSGLLYFIGRNAQGGINVHQSGLLKPMGLHFDAKTAELTMAGGYQIYRFQNILESDQKINHIFDFCYVPRTVNVTGQLDAHDIGVMQDNRVVFVNTAFNCLATLDKKYSFKALWRPPFISQLVKEDRCHLNGMAMKDGKPRYVTAVSRSDTIDGWRDRRDNGGIVIDIEKNKIICKGLSMPHSPRWHQGELWVLNAGTGELGIIKGAETGRGHFEPRVFCPGFLRGLAFYDNLAFICLSKPRYERFEGLALDKRLQETDSEPWCGIQIIDLTTNSCIDWFRIDGKVTELYDVVIIPNSICPMAVSPESPEAASLITFQKTEKNNEN